MRKGKIILNSSALFSLILIGLAAMPRTGYAHCDSMDGPVIKTARAALEKGDVTPLLKWVKRDYEGEIQDAFKKTLAVLGLNSQSKELADMYFFETVVRLHRAGEGAPYTGLKPAGIHDPAVEQADKALETGKIEPLKKMIMDKTLTGIQKRFTEALSKKKNADKSVEQGRQFVEAYIEFVHYVEGLYLDAAGEKSHHNEPEETAVSVEREHTH
ncbi:MAG: DUF6448 family protein [bacterium]|nr:DUF6448 family protein [bacterium]